MPRHVAIVMDGNGRWAAKRFMPRMMGHRAGVKAVRMAVDFCARHKIEVLSLFALSVENFQSRPTTEVGFLTHLLSDSLFKNLEELHQNNVRIRIMGDLSVFPDVVQTQVREAELKTKNNVGLTLVLAIHYGGRWDIFQAAQKFAQYVVQKQLDSTTLLEIG